MKLKIEVKPNSKKQEIEKISNQKYKIHLTSEPQKGKANVELLRLIKKHFKKQARIIKGLKSKNKVVEL